MVEKKAWAVYTVARFKLVERLVRAQVLVVQVIRRAITQLERCLLPPSAGRVLLTHQVVLVEEQVGYPPGMGLARAHLQTLAQAEAVVVDRLTIPVVKRMGLLAVKVAFLLLWLLVAVGQQVLLAGTMEPQVLLA